MADTSKMVRNVGRLTHCIRKQVQKDTESRLAYHSSPFEDVKLALLRQQALSNAALRGGLSLHGNDLVYHSDDMTSSSKITFFSCCVLTGRISHTARTRIQVTHASSLSRASKKVRAPSFFHLHPRHELPQYPDRRKSFNKAKQSLS